MVFLRNRLVVHLLVVLALVTAGISPACKFISGQYSVMEICGAQGAKKIIVASTDVPAKQNKEQHDHQRHDCGFCFAAGHLKGTQAAPVFIALPSENIIRLPLSLATTQISRDIASSYLARGPPSLVLS